MNADLSLALERVYETFERPLPRHIDACPCCRDKKNIAALTGKPLRHLSRDDLSSYIGSVFYTMGSVADFKYFLPRILEIVAGSERSIDVEIVLKKLGLAEWTSWRKHETEAVQAFVDAWFVQVLAETEDTLDAWALDGLVCGMALADFDLRPCFQHLIDRPLALMAWLEQNPDAESGVLGNAFWDGNEEQMKPVLAFLTSQGVQALIKN